MPNYILFQGSREILSSFSHVNGYLIDGLQSRGYRVCVSPTDGQHDVVLPRERPDVYMFHGYPYDTRSAPGRWNVFFLNYEFFRIKKQDEVLVDRLNEQFDLVVVASTFVRDVLTPYLRVPIEVVPWGVDPDVYNTGAVPVALPTQKRFKFVYAGAVYNRKGTDLLMKAYLDEFSADEDVCLVVKEALRIPHLVPWIDRVMGSAGRRRGAPEVLHMHRETESLAGYFAAADAGVFPFRGEGFGLPVLECIACGTPAIITGGTGPLDFVHAGNGRLVPAAPARKRDLEFLEPDIQALRQAMREAFEEGKPDAKLREKVAGTVQHLSWDNTVRALDSLLQRRPVGSGVTRGAGERRAAYVHYRRGMTSWQYCAKQIDLALSQTFSDYDSVGFRDPFPGGDLALLVGQSEFCCEQFLRAPEVSPGVVRILHQEGAVMAERTRISNKERRECGVPEVHNTPMELWRSRAECDAADRIMVPSSVAAKYFPRHGIPAGKLKIIPWGMRIARPRLRGIRAPVTFLFVGTDAYRKGIRLLFEAWDQLALQNARLVCYTQQSVLDSHRLLRCLVRNPSIEVRPLLPYRKFLSVYDEVDCQVLPSLEDSFSLSVGDGMGAGIPAIVSEDTGISDLISHGQDGYVISTGSVEALKEALVYFCERRQRLRDMGEAAHATARRYPWSRFRREFSAWISGVTRGN